MDGTQEFLCRALEVCRDDQDHLPWQKRVWEEAKFFGYFSAITALQFYPQNDREVLFRVLRTYCDAEDRGQHQSTNSVCESCEENAFENEIFIAEVVNAALEMLKKSPRKFGELFDQMILFLGNARGYFINTFTTLDRAEQQIIIDYLFYKVLDDPAENRYKIAYSECLKISGLEKGDPQFFIDSI